MSIHIEHIKKPDGDWLAITISPSSVENIKQVFQRALNCFPDAHPEVKDAGDLIIHGHILQDYWDSRTDPEGKMLMRERLAQRELPL